MTVDDRVNSGLNELFIPSPRDVLFSGFTGKRRSTKLKEDTTQLQFELRGWWIDDPNTSKYWRDFKAALLNQVQQPFDLGDGTEFRMVDVLDVVSGSRSGIVVGATGNTEAYVYTAKCLSYEPYARSKSPTLDLFHDYGAAAVGTDTFSGTYNYSGTAPGEPTWQWKLILPVGCTVTSVTVQNSTTGETCVVSGLTLTNGTYYLLMDAVGGLNNGQTPNNNGYGLLGTASNGFGATLTGVGDVHFTGNVPTLKHSNTIPPVAVGNSITGTVVVTGGPATSVQLSVLAPSRWVR